MLIIGVCTIGLKVWNKDGYGRREYVPREMKSSGDISAGPIRGQKIEVGTDLDLRNDENRQTLTSSAAAEEHQKISVSGPSAQSIYRKNAGILVEISNRFFLTLWWKVIFKTWCSTTQKRQKLVTEMYHKQLHPGSYIIAVVDPVARTSTYKWETRFFLKFGLFSCFVVNFILKSFIFTQIEIDILMTKKDYYES